MKFDPTHSKMVANQVNNLNLEDRRNLYIDLFKKVVAGIILSVVYICIVAKQPSPYYQLMTILTLFACVGIVWMMRDDLKEIRALNQEIDVYIKSQSSQSD